MPTLSVVLARLPCIVCMFQNFYAIDILSAIKILDIKFFVVDLMQEISIKINFALYKKNKRSQGSPKARSRLREKLK